MTRRARLARLSLFLAGLGLARAEAAPDLVVAAEDIVVTATRLPPAPAAPGVSVITAADIQRSTAHGLGELLAAQANVQLRAYGGSGKNAGIDIRGMGDTAGSNVLILVDGVRLNEADLSGADLSTLPLARIERIEVRRGGGAVRHGDGAVGGVVEITTRPAGAGAKRGEWSLRLDDYGSFDLQGAAGASIVTSAGTLDASLFLNRHLTPGYRENEDVEAYDLSLDLRWAPSGAARDLALRAKLDTHHDVTGLPGPVSAAAFAAGEASRRASNTPHDESASDRHGLLLGLSAGRAAQGRLELTLGRRVRDNPFLIGYTPLLPRASQEGLIQSDGWDLSAVYSRDFDAAGNGLRAGLDWRVADYTRLENGRQVLGNSTRRLGEMSSAGLFTDATLALGRGLSLNAGLRVERFASDEADARYTRADCQITLVEVSPGVFVPVLSNCVDAYRLQSTNHGRWWNQGAELGLTWRAGPALSGAVSLGRHYRNPNVDEMLLAAEHLRPQRGHTLQAGLRYRPGPRLNLSATWFRMRTRDEIYYGIDPVSGLSENRNYEHLTRRDGIELELSWRPRDNLALRTALGYTRPVFAGSGADIPHAPRRNLSGEVEWSPGSAAPAASRWVLAMRHVGRRYDGNDADNDLYPSLPSHTLWDLALRHSWRGLRVSVGLVNLFDRAYSVLGYSASYYPMPGRHFHLGLQGRF